MFRTILIVLACLPATLTLQAQGKFGDNPLIIDLASAIEIESTSQGFLPSRMTTVQRDAQTEWDEAHIIYNIDDDCLQIYTGTEWLCLTTGIDSTIYKFNSSLTSDRNVDLNNFDLAFDGSAGSVVITAAGDLGVGTPTPNRRLDVEGDYAFRLSNYGSGTSSGTETYLLGVESDGDVIEVSPALDSFLIVDDTLYVSQMIDNVPAYSVDLKPYGRNVYSVSDTIVADRVLYGNNNRSFSFQDITTWSISNTDEVDITTTNDIRLDAGGDIDFISDSTSVSNHLRLSAYGGGTNTGTETFVLGVEADGDVIEIDPASLDTDQQAIDVLGFDGTNISISLDRDMQSTRMLDISSVNTNIYSDNGSLAADRTVTLGTNSLTFSAADDVVIDASGNLTVGGNLTLDRALIDASGDAGGIGQILSSTSTGTNWIDAPINTDDQTVDEFSLIGSTLSLSLEDDGQLAQTVDLSSINTDDQTVDEFSLIGSTLSLSLEDDGQLAQTVDLSSIDTDTDDQTVDEFSLSGSTLSLSLEDDGQLAQTVDLSSINTDDQTVDEFSLIGSTLSLSLEDDGQLAQTVDLSSIDTDTDDQTVDEFSLSGSTLSLSLEDDGQLAQTVDLSSIDTDTDDQTVDEFSLSGSTLSLSLEDDGQLAQTVDLSSINTDDQTIDLFSLSGTTLSLSLEDDGQAAQTVDLSPILGSSDNIYNTDGALDAVRTVDMNGNSLTFAGSDDDLVMHSDGDISLGTATANGDFNAVSDQNQNAFHFTQTNVLTGERDVFTIEDQDGGGGSQDHSSVLKVEKSGALVATATGDLGFSLVELAYTAGGAPAQDSSQYWISGRKTDEGAPLWGVDLTDNDFWSEGGIVLGVNGASDGTYSGGQFIVEPTGDVGIGTTSPSAKLDVAGGLVRFREYGQDTPALNDTSVNHILTVDSDGNVRELNTAKNTRWFYAPAVTIDASVTGLGSIDLYQEYYDQFTQPVVASPGAPASIPYYERDELWFIVTYNDNTVIDNITIDANGVMDYEIVDVPFDNYTIINIVVVIK